MKMKSKCSCSDPLLVKKVDKGGRVCCGVRLKIRDMEEIDKADRAV